LPHGTFLTAIKRSGLFVRTYVFDGICSSVLEALSLGIPVVGCENELRPKEVILFRTGDDRDLAAKIAHVFEHYEHVKAQISRPATRNTLVEEVDLLVDAR
jgi:glycosyltransferase involved in cell wall biosynthesis